MNKSLRERSKEELKGLLEYFENAKNRIADTLKNAKEMYDATIKEYNDVKEELERKNDGDKG